MSDSGDKWYYIEKDNISVGPFGSWEEAVFEATQEDENDDRVIELGTHREPQLAEGFIDADYVLQYISTQEEYCFDWAEEGWPNSTKEQDVELTESIQKVIGEWLDRHDLRPNWKTIVPEESKTRKQAKESVEQRLKLIQDYSIRITH